MAKYITKYILCLSFVLLTPGFMGNVLGRDDELVSPTRSSSPPTAIEMDADLKLLSLSLKDSIVYALRNNFDIVISQLNSRIENDNITIEKAKYDPTLQLTGTLENNETPINSQLVGGLQSTAISPYVEQGKTADAVIQSMIPTGATVSLGYNIFRDYVDPNPFLLMNPSYQNYVEAKITQPLLKGAGWFYNRSLINIARNNKKISLSQFKSKAMEVSNSIQEAYWNLVKAIENLRVAKKSMERAEDLLRKNQIQVKAGTLAPIETVDAEAEVASRLEAIITAENEIKNKEDALKKIMHFTDNNVISDAAILPTDKPVSEQKKVALQDTIRIAMEKRPELQELQLGTENAGIQVKRRKNELFPSLDLTGGMRYTGLGNEVSSANDSVFSESFQSEYFTLSLGIPIGNRSARSEYNKSKLEMRQADINVKKKELDIVVEVRGAVRQAMTNIERMNATRKARELAQKRLDVEEKKYSVGRSTSLEVLRAQESLAIAEGNEIKAMVDYEISLGSLDKAKGMILETYNIRLEEEKT